MANSLVAKPSSRFYTRSPERKPPGLLVRRSPAWGAGLPSGAAALCPGDDTQGGAHGCWIQVAVPTNSWEILTNSWNIMGNVMGISMDLFPPTDGPTHFPIVGISWEIMGWLVDQGWLVDGELVVVVNLFGAKEGGSLMVSPDVMPQATMEVPWWRMAIVNNGASLRMMVGC